MRGLNQRGIASAGFLGTMFLFWLGAHAFAWMVEDEVKQRCGYEEIRQVKEEYIYEKNSGTISVGCTDDYYDHYHEDWGNGIKRSAGLDKLSKRRNHPPFESYRTEYKEMNYGQDICRR